jgi:hypothetical protein
MNLPLENLELLPKVLQEIQSLKLRYGSKDEKRWLSTRELSRYIAYSLDGINKMVKDGVFIDGLHYHKPQKKLLFDKEQIDNWIIGLKDKKHKDTIDSLVDDVLQGIE